MNVGKKGWIRILEACIAALLVAVVLLIAIGGEDIGKKNPSSEIYDSQLFVLRDIQMNDTLRQSVLDAILPVESNETGFPQDVKERIEYLVLDYLECKAKICEIESDCNLNIPQEKDIYVQSVLITANLETYSPRQLKLFCTVGKWEGPLPRCARTDVDCGVYPNCEDCTILEPIDKVCVSEIIERIYGYYFECVGSSCGQKINLEIIEDCPAGCSEIGGAHCCRTAGQFCSANIDCCSEICANSVCET